MAPKTDRNRTLNASRRLEIVCPGASVRISCSTITSTAVVELSGYGGMHLKTGCGGCRERAELREGQLARGSPQRLIGSHNSVER